GQRVDRLDIGDAVESLERSREHFRCRSRANQRVCFVRESEELAGKNVDSAAGGRVSLRLRNQLFDALPAKTLWLRVFHRIFILARASDTASIPNSPQNLTHQRAKQRKAEKNEAKDNEKGEEITP